MTRGSNWVPAQRASSSSAACTLIAVLYGRSASMASKASHAHTMRAPSGIISPRRPSGQPRPSQRSCEARTIRATGDFNDDVGALMRGQYEICLMTYEKCAALALGAPHILDEVGTIVVDEVQMIVDPNRGANLEFLLTLLRVRR